MHVKDEGNVYSAEGIGTGLVAARPKFPVKIVIIICNHAIKKNYCGTMHVWCICFNKAFELNILL